MYVYNKNVLYNNDKDKNVHIRTKNTICWEEAVRQK